MAKGKYALKRDEELKKLRRQLASKTHEAKVATENLEATRLSLGVSRQANFKLRAQIGRLKFGVLMLAASSMASLVYVLHVLNP